MPKKIWERQLPRNTGFAFEMKFGQSVRITAQTIIDFVCFNGENLRERFDQARTKANQRKVFISTGDLLVSKLNNTMMTIIEDTFTEGHHDLQEGMCSRKRHELAAQRGIWEITYKRPLSEMPPRGCTENPRRKKRPRIGRFAADFRACWPLSWGRCSLRTEKSSTKRRCGV